MRIVGFDPVTDTARIRACHELFAAAEPVDDPGMPMMSLPVFSGWFAWAGTTARGRPGWCPAVGTAPGRGRPARAARDENTRAAMLHLVVAPALRREGIGTALLRHVARRAAGLGRTLLSGDAREGGAGSPFAAAAGAPRG